LHRAEVRGGVERVQRASQVVGEVADVVRAAVGKRVGETVEVVAYRVDQSPERLLVHTPDGDILITLRRETGAARKGELPDDDQAVTWF
jgi:hypothetical protein